MEESNIDVLTANRMYKSRIFAMLFSDRNELLKLYNAINGTSYDDPDLLQVNTLEAPLPHRGAMTARRPGRPSSRPRRAPRGSNP